MTSEDPWITARVAEARDNTPSLPEAVSLQMDQFLRGELSERTLSPARLSTIAKRLIACMAPDAPKLETLQ